MKSRNKGQTIGHRIINTILLSLCLAGIVIAGLLVATTIHEGQAYDSLCAQQSVRSSSDSSNTDHGIDWAALRAQNPDIAAWLSVDKTSIDYPVVSTRTTDPEGYYLHHDFWRNPSFAGCPYIDSRTNADTTHVLVYGHHLSLSDQLFSQLFNVYKQSRFDEIGDATWSTPDKGTVVFRPAFALSVDMDYPNIQTFEFRSDDDLHAWLSTLASHASAKSAECTNQISQAKRVLTLVTCSSNFSGQRARTLVVFLK